MRTHLECVELYIDGYEKAIKRVENNGDVEMKDKVDICTASREYADKNNLESIQQFVEARSGYKEQARVEFYKMLEFIQETKTEHLIFVCTDRLYRNIEDYVRLKDTGVNIQLHKVWENRSFRLLDPDAFEEVSQHERDLVDSKKFSAQLSYRVRKSIKENVEQGIYLGHPPLGYIKNKITKKIELDEERAPLVVKAFQLYATGQYGLLDLTKKMRDLGLTTAQGNLVEKNAVYWALRNPFYKGIFRYSGKLHSNRGINNDREPSYPILISPELFDEVQRILGSKNNVIKKSSYEFHLYRKAILCGFCGCVLTPEKITKKSGKEYTYYHCTNGKGQAFYEKKFKMKKCPQKWWKEEEIEEEFTSEIGLLHFDEGIMGWLRKEMGEHEKEQQEITASQLKNLRAEQTLNEKKLRRLYEDKVEGDIPEDWFKEEFEKTRERQDEIKAEIDHLEESEDVSMEENIQTLELMKDFKNQYLTATLEKKVLMHKYIFRTVYAYWRVLKDRNLRGMNFVYNEPFKSLLEIGVMEKSEQLKVPPLDEYGKWCAYQDSNLGPTDPESLAL